MPEKLLREGGFVERFHYLYRFVDDFSAQSRSQAFFRFDQVFALEDGNALWVLSLRVYVWHVGNGGHIHDELGEPERFAADNASGYSIAEKDVAIPCEDTEGEEKWKEK